MKLINRIFAVAYFVSLVYSIYSFINNQSSITFLVFGVFTFLLTLIHLKLSGNMVENRGEKLLAACSLAVFLIVFLGMVNVAGVYLRTIMLPILLPFSLFLGILSIFVGVKEKTTGQTVSVVTNRRIFYWLMFLFVILVIFLLVMNYIRIEIAPFDYSTGSYHL